MTIQQAKDALLALCRKQFAYNHASGMLFFDGVTAAPSDTAAVRGETLAVLSEAAYELATGEETVSLLDFLYDSREELDSTSRRLVEVMHKDIADTRKLPKVFYVEHQRLINDAEAVWHKAKETNDYALFEPYLARLVADARQIAGYISPEKDAYEFWLNKYEEGLTRERCEAFFDALRTSLVPLIHQICAAPQIDDTLLHTPVPLEKQRVLSDRLMAVMQLDRAHCGIAETEHPFTVNFSKQDVRITTHYYETEPASSMYSVIHEGGHALYELHTGDKLQFTPLGNGASMALHESQSRLYENLLGRSRAFIGCIGDDLRALSPVLSSVSDEDFYRMCNRSQPSLIRTEADELTYSLHIMVRYQLEKRLLDGTLTTKELPAAWNAMYKEYLGVDVPDDTHGVLQDSHWSGGDFGYFPSYALGSAYGVQILAKMKETVDVDGCLARGDMKPINDWLCARIWQYGCLYKPAELLERVIGSFDPSCYTDYLAAKFGELYSI